MSPNARPATTRGFLGGQTIAWRNRTRDVAREHHPSYATAMTVVRDTPHDLVLYRGPGYPMRRRNAEVNVVAGFRHHPVTRYLHGWQADPDWGRWHVLQFMDPRGHHAVSLFRDATTNLVDFWYIDLIGPADRRLYGFDFLEHGLDIVVQADFSAWRWKDEDELEWSVQAGRYTRAEADALYAEGTRAVERLLRERLRFKEWSSWHPDPTWAMAVLPVGWDAV